MLSLAIPTRRTSSTSVQERHDVSASNRKRTLSPSMASTTLRQMLATAVDVAAEADAVAEAVVKAEASSVEDVAVAAVEIVATVANSVAAVARAEADEAVSTPLTRTLSQLSARRA